MTKDNKECRRIGEEMQRHIKYLKTICSVNISFSPFNPKMLHNGSSIEVGTTNLVQWLKQNYNVFLVGKHFIREDKKFNDYEWNSMKGDELREYHPHIKEKNEVIDRFRFVISEFFNVRIILNTHFNIHSYRITKNIKNTLHVLENSELEFLEFGNYIIRKKQKEMPDEVRESFLK